MEDKSAAQSRQIAEVYREESAFRLKPHLACPPRMEYSLPEGIKAREFVNQLTASIEEVMRCKDGEDKR